MALINQLTKTILDQRGGETRISMQKLVETTQVVEELCSLLHIAEVPKPNTVITRVQSTKSTKYTFRFVDTSH